MSGLAGKPKKKPKFTPLSPLGTQKISEDPVFYLDLIISGTKTWAGKSSAPEALQSIQTWTDSDGMLHPVQPGTEGLQYLKDAFAYAKSSMKNIAIDRATEALKLGVPDSVMNTLLQAKTWAWGVVHWYLWARTSSAAMTIYGPEKVEQMLNGTYTPSDEEAPF